MPELTMEEFWNKLLTTYSTKMGELMRSPDEWKNFLKASSYYYKMRFDQQVMVYAQRPTAKVIAMSDQWFKLYRPVEKSSKAVYVFKDEHRKKKRYLRYYEPSETRTTKKSMRIPTWEMKPEYQTSIAEALKNSFENTDDELKTFDTSSFESILLSATEVITTDNIEGYYDNLLSDTEFSRLEDMPENEVLTVFDRIVVNSVGYSVLSRLGIDPEKYINSSIFNDIQKFNTEEVLSAVGTATQQLSRTAITVIAKAVKQYENTYNKEVHSYDRRTHGIDSRRISRVQENDSRREGKVQQISDGREKLYGTASHQVDGGSSEEILRQENRTVVSPERGRNIRSDDRDTGGRGTVGGSVRTQPEGVSRNEKVSEVREDAVLGSTEQPLQPDTRGVQGTGGTPLQGNGTDRGTDGGAEAQRPDGLGTDEQPHQGTGAGDSPQRQGLRLTGTEIDKEETKAEIGDTSTSAFSYSQELIEKAFIYGNNFSGGKERIYEYISRGLSNDENAKFLKNEYGVGGVCPAFVFDGRKIELAYSGNGIEITAKNEKSYILNWKSAAQIVSRLVSENRYLTNEELAEYISKYTANTDKFFVYEESQSITWMYYNPDSTAGGQFVTNTLTFDGIAEAAERYDSADDFFDHLGGIARQNLADVGSEWFDSALEEFNGVAAYEGCSQETMQSLIGTAQKALMIDNKVTVTVSFSEHPAFYRRDPEKDEFVDRYNVLSFAAANRLFELLDKKQYTERESKEIGWYHKTDFVIKGTVNGEEIEYSGRYDIGDGDGSLISHIESYYDYMIKPDSYRNYELSGKELEESIDRLKADKEKITKLLTAVSALTDDDVRIVDEVMATEPDWYPQATDLVITADMYDISNPAVFVTPKGGKIADIDIIPTDELFHRLSEKGINRNENSQNRIIYETDGNNWNRVIIPDRWGNKTNGIDIADIFSEEEIQTASNITEQVLESEPERDEPLSLFDFAEINAVETEEIQPADPSVDELIGKEVVIDDRRYVVERVGKISGDVSLRDVTFRNNTGFPINRVEKVDYVRSLLEHTADRKEENYSEAEVTVIPSKPKEPAIDFDLSVRGLTGIAVGKKVRFQRNIEAIKVLKNCTSEDRRATAQEQETLSRYVGWGGLQEAFDPNNTAWRNEYNELKELLTDNEYNNASESTLTAFYTPPVVINAIYTALESFGFQKGNILEPSCGIGNFIGMLPGGMKESKVYGVEMEDISAGIAQQLYQSASVICKPFEKTQFSDNFFDAAVGNVPFNDIKVVDARYQKYKFYIHDYFFAKTLDKLRPGGIAALITSQGTMDRTNTSVRKYIAQRAELIGAIRLPNNTFGGNAGADGVTSDILFLQKRERICDIEPDWVHLGIGDNGIRMNQYFADHPEMILGEMKMISSAYGPKAACVSIEDTDLDAMLSRAVSRLTAQITEYEVEFDEEVTTIPADPNVRNNSYTVVGGKLYYRVDSVMEERSFDNERGGKSKAERIRAMIPLRDCTRTLIDRERETYTDEAIKELQKQLNTLYDTFVMQYGRLNDKENIKAFEEDASSALLSSLEEIDGEGNFKGKSAIFYKRTINPYIEITKADTVQEALAISLSEKAYVDMPYMMKLTGKTESEVFSELDGAIFLNPEYNERIAENAQNTEHNYLSRDEYLSGNVREKLSMAQSFATRYDTFKANVTALEAVQPKDLTPSEISVSVGTTWIPEKYYTDFAYHFAGLSKYDHVKVIYSEYTSTWKVDGRKWLSNANIDVVYGTKRINGLEIFERMLNLKQVRVFDTVYENGKSISVLNEKETELARDKQEEIELAFEQWIWSEPKRRRELVAIYNAKFNSIVPRHYDGSQLTFPGMNPEISLYKHQRDAVARIIYGGNTLLAHCVGAGKTFTMITASQELKRLGLCSKSLIVVPIHLLKQWRNEYMRLYPGANILVSTPDDFSAKGRKRFTAKIATGDYDAVIITQSQFAKIQLSPAIRQEYVQDELDKVDLLLDETNDKHTVKELQKTKKNLKNKLDLLLAEEKKDDMIYFDELGIYRIFVDEAHAYKNMYHVTKMSNVSGLVSRESQRATSMHFICRYLDEATQGKGVIFATGTPLANSLSEVYTLMSNLQMGLLSRLNMQLFDNWASTFARAVTEFELATEGNSLIEKTRFSQFINVPELRIMVEEVMDVQTASMLKLNVPNAVRITELNPPSEIQKEIMGSFAERADEFRRKVSGYRRQEMLLIANDGKKMSLDQRVYDPNLPPAEDSKISRCAKNVYDLYVRFESIKGTQMVFCDLSVPNKSSKGYCAYEDLKEQLIAKGIPENEIRFVHEANTDEKKDRLFKKVRSGEVRVLIGSTEKMGTGTNAQDRLIGLHHLTCPWRPIDLEQREGRIIRQGNMNKEVYIYTYVTEGTFDANMYQTVARKQRVASQFLSEDPPRTCEDIDEATLTYYDIAALTTGNPLMKEQAELQKEIAKLQRQKITYDNQNFTLQDRVEVEIPRQIKLQKTVINALMRDVHIAKEHPKSEEFCGIEIEERQYADKKEGGDALQAVLHSSFFSSESVSIGSYRGFDLRMEYDIKHKVPIVCLKGNAEYKATYSESSTGIIAKLDNLIGGIEEKLENAKTRLNSYQKEEIEARKALEKVFPYAEELEKKKARFAEINRELSQDKASTSKEGMSLNDPAGTSK